MPVHTSSPRARTPVEPITAPRSLRGWWIPDLAFALLRVVAALLLAQRGVETHFGDLLGAGRAFHAPLMWSEPWIVGWLELAGGALLAIGLFTRLVAFVLAVVSAFVFVVENAPRYWPIANGAEVLALLCVAFLAIAAIGPGLFSVDALIGTRRTRMSPMTVNISPWIKRQYRRRELTR